MSRSKSFRSTEIMHYINSRLGFALLVSLSCVSVKDALAQSPQPTPTATRPPNVRKIEAPGQTASVDRLDIVDPETPVTYACPESELAHEPSFEGPYLRQPNTRVLGTGVMTADYAVEWTTVDESLRVVNNGHTLTYADVYGWGTRRALNATRLSGEEWPIYYNGTMPVSMMNWYYTGMGRPIATATNGYAPEFFSGDPPASVTNQILAVNVWPVTTDACWNSVPDGETWKNALPVFGNGISAKVHAHYLNRSYTEPDFASPYGYFTTNFQMLNDYNIRWHLPYEDARDIAADSTLLQVKKLWQFFPVSKVDSSGSGSGDPGPYEPSDPVGIGSGENFEAEIAPIQADALLDYIYTKAFFSMANVSQPFLEERGVPGMLMSATIGILSNDFNPEIPGPKKVQSMNTYWLWRQSVNAARAQSTGDPRYDGAPIIVSFGPEGDVGIDTPDDVAIDSSEGHSGDQHWLRARLIQVGGLYTFTDTGKWAKKYGRNGYLGPAVFKVPVMSGFPSNWPEGDTSSSATDIWYGVYTTDYNKA